MAYQSENTHSFQLCTCRHTHSQCLKESSKVDEVSEAVLVEGGQVMKVRLMEHESFCAYSKWLDPQYQN